MYAGLFLVVILVILLENSYLLIDQTSTTITETSWLDTNNLINSIIAGARQSIDYVQLSDQQLHRHIRKISIQIDRLYEDAEKPAEEEFSDIIQYFKIISFSILDEDGNKVYAFNQSSLPEDIRGRTFTPGSSPEAIPLPRNDQSTPLRRTSFRIIHISDTDPELQMLSLPRRRQEGRINIFFDREKLQEIKARIGLQLVINSYETQDVIQSISFMNDQLVIIADYEPSRINMLDENLDYLDSLRDGKRTAWYDPVNETMKWVHPIAYTQDLRGVFRVSFKRTGVQQIYANTRNITIINSIIIMLLATISAIIMLFFHRRNISKMESMESQIRENEKLVSLANLTAGVAHEVRNPLNSISITIQRLQMEFTPSKQTEQDDYMMLTDTMKNEVDRINTIITDFLDFAKPFSPNNDYFDLDDFINENINFFSAESRKAKISVETSISTNHTQFYGDREKLTQVLINLFLNALEATPGKGFISIYSEITRDNNWQLKIEDNGEGISSKHLFRIFDIYFTTKKSGSGLGLYISRKIIQAHDGTIELKPNPAKGTTVVVTLPIKNN